MTPRKQLGMAGRTNSVLELEVPVSRCSNKLAAFFLLSSPFSRRHNCIKTALQNATNCKKGQRVVNYSHTAGLTRASTDRGLSNRRFGLLACLLVQ